MVESLFAGNTIDDAMRSVFEAILSDGEKIRPSKGDALELRGVLLEVTNPRARLSRTETRGKPFSCLGELCWYLAKSSRLDLIKYYIPDYEEYADGETIYGAYGTRMFDWRGLNQMANVIDLLKRKRDSRQAVIQLFDATDILESHKDIPCTCTLQFLLRSDKLDMFSSMRSNDAYRGMAHDIFSFTMLQEIVARSVSAEVGKYMHAVGSLHLYDVNLEGARQYLAEGWQSTMPMPAMPEGDPWTSIRALGVAEEDLRVSGSLERAAVDEVDPFWADLMRLLQVFRSWKDGNAEQIRSVREEMSSDVYSTFIDQRYELTVKNSRPRE